MSQLTVDIISAECAFLEGKGAASVTAPGINGEFQVLPEHTTFLTELEPGPVVLEGPSGSQSFVVSGGFAEVAEDHVRILADEATAVSSIDLGNVKQALEAVETELTAADPYSYDSEALRKRQGYLQAQLHISP